MENSKFLEFLKIIKGKLRRDLKDFMFVTSNRLTEREKEIFLNILNKSVKVNFTNELLIKSELKEEEIIKWNRIKSRLVKVIKRFLLLNLIEEKESMANILLLNYFFEKGMSKNFSSSLKKGYTDLSKGQSIDQQSALYHFWLHEIEVKVRKNERKEDHNLNLMTQHLDGFYIENRLRCLCEQINRKHVINTDYDSEHFIEFIEKRDTKTESPGVQIYYNIFKMLTAKNKDSFFKNVNHLIQENFDFFSRKYVREIYDHLMNFCIRKINNGETSYASKYLKYIDFLSEEKIFLESGTLSTMRYKNCITISLVAKNSQWAEHFLESNLKYLERSIKENAYKFNKAQILFHQGKQEDCKNALIGFHPFDMYYKIAYDKLWLMLNYPMLENDKYDFVNFKKKIESLKKYIQIQKKLRPEKKSKIVLFLNVLSLLVRNKKIDIESLLGKISIMDYFWVKEIYNMEKRS